MPARVRYPSYPNIQWFDPPIDLTRGRVMDEASEGSGRWATHLRFVLDRVRSTDVGRAVMSSVRRRTTVYPSADRAQTDADPYPDNPLDLEPGVSPEEARLLAATTGTHAMIFIDPSGRIERTGGADASTPAASLLHELVHAVNITWGTYQDRGYTSDEARRRGAGSPEEEIAWVVDNMHRSETGMWLRQRYDGEGLAPPDSRTLSSSSNTFAMQAVSRCDRRLRILAARLEPIACRYNPFREYAHLPPTARP